MSRGDLLLRSLLMLGFLICSIGGLLKYWQVRQAQESQRLLAISRLGLDSQMSWEEVEHYVDCELVTLGMERDQLEANLARFGTYSLNDVTSSGIGKLIVEFKEYSLEVRYYSFYDGLLTGRYRRVGGLDGPEEIDCSGEGE